MPELIYDPPVNARDARDAREARGFTQCIALVERDQSIALARWHAPREANDGVMQILDLIVAPEHGRKGHGRALLRAAIEQASEYFRARELRLRRVWILVQQKQQVIGRAFFTQNGFHHVATIPDLLRDQDALVYVRSMD